MTDSNGSFDKESFIKAYSDSAYAQASVIAGAFETMDQRFDGVDARFDAVEGRLDTIEAVLKEAFPDQYNKVRARLESGG